MHKNFVFLAIRLVPGKKPKIIEIDSQHVSNHLSGKHSEILAYVSFLELPQ